jgi:hypothetical protein
VLLLDEFLVVEIPNCDVSIAATTEAGLVIWRNGDGITGRSCGLYLPFLYRLTLNERGMLR